MMSYLFVSQISQIFLTKWRIFLWYMAAINYSWQRFLSPCGCHCHKSSHRIMPIHSHVDSCVLNWAYSLTLPKGTFGHIACPCWQVSMCMPRLPLSNFLIKWEHFPPLGRQAFEFVSTPILCENHIKYITLHTIYHSSLCLIQTTFYYPLHFYQTLLLIL